MNISTKTCPDCAEEIRAEARICRHCRYEFWDQEVDLRHAHFETSQAHPHAHENANTGTANEPTEMIWGRLNSAETAFLKNLQLSQDDFQAVHMAVWCDQGREGAKVVIVSRANSSSNSTAWLVKPARAKRLESMGLVKRERQGWENHLFSTPLGTALVELFLAKEFWYTNQRWGQVKVAYVGHA